MPFAILAVPFDSYAALPTAQHRWVLMALARYTNREGRCWPSMRQLARDTRMSKSSVQRYLADLSQLGIFSRERRPGDRYRYVINPAFRPNYRHRPAGVPAVGRAVPRVRTEQAIAIKHQDSRSEISKAEPPLTPAERAERVQRLDAVLAGLMREARAGARSALR